MAGIRARFISVGYRVPSSISIAVGSMTGTRHSRQLPRALGSDAFTSKPGSTRDIFNEAGRRRGIDRIPTDGEADKNEMIYLDHCATTPLDERVAQAMQHADEAWGNPSSVHKAGRRSRAIINEARSRIAQVLGASPSEIVLTASASEANNLALKGAAMRTPGKPFRLVISAIEHDCVRYTARYLDEKFDWVHLHEVSPGTDGVIDPDAIARACESGADLVCVMAVNNETGILQPTAEIAAIAHACGALFHCDAVQAAGRMDLAPITTQCDFLSLAAHKIYGPRGAGLLYVRDGTRVDSLIHGGHQEKGRRAGTEVPHAIAGFACALELAAQDIEANNARLSALQGAFLQKLDTLGIPYIINGTTTHKVPGVVNLSIPGIDSADLVVGMDLEGIAISAGSACSSGVIEPSHVLLAMRLDAEQTAGGIRVSFGRGNSKSEAIEAAETLAALSRRLSAHCARPGKTIETTTTGERK